jgi:predicted nucleic acid-binding protein
VYLDSSVILRVVLGESGVLREWSRITLAVTSEVARVECLRTLDRMRLAGALQDRELARRRATTLELLDAVQAIRINRAVLDKASEPFPTLVRSLDAIHLASALLARTSIAALRFATHDAPMATAALAMGLKVIGANVPSEGKR